MTNSWNAFQASLAGSGLSTAERAALYRAQGAGNASSSSSGDGGASARSSSSSSRSDWNQHQRDHAGLGLSRAEVAASYHASRSSASPPVAARPVARSSSTASRPSSASSNPWNEHQRAVAGLGLSRTEVSATYQAPRTSSSTARPTRSSQPSAREAAAAAAIARSSSSSNASSASPQASGATSSSTTTTARTSARATASTSTSASVSASASARPASASSTATSTRTTQPSSARDAAAAAAISRSASNAWNQYQRDHAGEGLSRAELRAGYRASQAGTAPPPAPQTATTTTTARTPAATPSTSSSSNSWNAFQRENAGKGLSNRQMALLYRYQPSASATTSTASAATAQPGTQCANSRRPNAFNEFQKQYKRDHPHEKLSARRAVELYRAQQRQDQAGTAPALPLRERLQRNLERIQQEQLAIALQQQESEPDDDHSWISAARWLEWEEANFLRELFVQDQPPSVWESVDLSELKHCEFIHADRLDLEIKASHCIGRGGMGDVYRATIDGAIPVAVKVAQEDDADTTQLFKQEMQALVLASEHPNVLNVFGYTVLRSDSGELSFGIVMEMMNGGDLEFALQRSDIASLSGDDRLQILLQVIRAIEYLHAQGITHRDLKPKNVLLSGDRKTAKLADFGLAGYKDSVRMTQQTRAVGRSHTVEVTGHTDEYAAPEVFQRRLSYRDTAWVKSDVFAFTVMMAAVLMDEMPWATVKRSYIRHAVCELHERPFDVGAIVQKTGNARFRSLVEEGWHQDASVRPSAKEMRERLERIVQEEETAAKVALAVAVSSPRGVEFFGDFDDSYADFAHIYAD